MAWSSLQKLYKSVKEVRVRTSFFLGLHDDFSDVSILTFQIDRKVLICRSIVFIKFFLTDTFIGILRRCWCFLIKLGALGNLKRISTIRNVPFLFFKVFPSSIGDLRLTGEEQSCVRELSMIICRKQISHCLFRICGHDHRTNHNEGRKEMNQCMFKSHKINLLPSFIIKIYKLHLNQKWNDFINLDVS